MISITGAGDNFTDLDFTADRHTRFDAGAHPWSEEDLAQMDERQNTGDSFEFDGGVWLYRRSREVRASSDGRQPAPFYYWEFQEQGGKRLLAIRKLEGEPFAVTVFTGIPEGDVTVYRDR